MARPVLRAAPALLLSALLLAALLLAGCSSGPEPEPPAPVEAEPGPDPWEGADRVALVRGDFDGAEADLPLCLNGGQATTAPEFRRTPEAVHEGTERLEFTVAADPTWPGLQVGYAHGGDEWTWLPTVRGGPETFTVPVAPDQWETWDEEEDTAEWRFTHRVNLPPPGEQECWTGGGAGRWTVLVEAVRGDASTEA